MVNDFNWSLDYDEIYHHGIKGQKWGIKNGPPYPLDTPINRAKSAAKTKLKVDDIISTFNSIERERFGLNNPLEEYLDYDQGEYVIHRALIEVGDVPVAFFDMLDDGDTINLALGTRNDSKYRGKGYSSKAASQALNYIKKHPEKRKGRDIIWGVKEDNIGSIKIALKNGFIIDESSKNNGWINYVLKGE